MQSEKDIAVAHWSYSLELIDLPENVIALLTVGQTVTLNAAVCLLHQGSIGEWEKN